MTLYRPFSPLDLLDFNAVNLDRFTETYHFSFYSHYFVNWPEYNQVACRLDGRPIGYVMGKSEGTGRNWHGHVTAITIAPSHRKLGIAKVLMRHLEDVSEQY
jgi:N-terminal acetyltransferase B complex catalytic subunit